MTRSALENDLASKLIDHRVRPSATAQKIRDETFRFHATPTFDQDYHAGSKRGKQGLHYGRLTMGQVANAFPETFPSEPCEVASRDAQKKVRRPPRRRLSGPPRGATMRFQCPVRVVPPSAGQFVARHSRQGREIGVIGVTDDTRAIGGLSGLQVQRQRTNSCQTRCDRFRLSAPNRPPPWLRPSRR